MIILHHLNNSRSQRVLLLLEELGLPYEIVRHERDRKTMLAPPELVKVHPLGKSPVIVDEGTTVAETGAIIEYLLEKYGNGRLEPARGTPEHLRFTYFLHYAEGSLMPFLLLKLIFDRVESGPMPFFVKPIARGIANKVKGLVVTPNLTRHLDFLEGELGRSQWFAGDEFTGADVQMSYPLEAAKMRGGLDASRPRLMSWLERLHARPAYQRALERGGKYDMAD